MLDKNITLIHLSFNRITETETIQCIEEKISFKGKLRIISPHFYHIVLCKAKKELLRIVSEYELVLPDGYGVYAASRFLYGKNGFDKVYNGTDLYDIVLKEAIRKSWTIYFLGDTEETIRALKENIPSKYPKLNIAGAHHGFFDFFDSKIVEEINESKADILMVGMGFPRQDLWITENYEKLTVPVIMSVGAGIGFISGNRKRAPKIVRVIHLEWLFRLFQEPQRLWRRYIIGIPQFCFYILLQKFRKTI